MSTKITKAILLLFAVSITAFASGQTVTFNKQFSSDTIYNIDREFRGKCSNAELNGSIVLYSDTSVVRIFLTDTKGNKWMMAEVYPLISSDTVITLLRKAEETKYLAYNTDPKYLEFYITDASVTVSTIVFSNKNNLNYVALARTNKMNVENAKVNRMNINLEDKGLLWRAVLSEQVLINYYKRSLIEGSFHGNIDGYWYYGGGYYCDYSTYDRYVNETKISRANDTLPTVQTHSFDWRKVHGANLPTSPYFDGNPDYTLVWDTGGTYYPVPEIGNGWLTSAKRQKYWVESCPDGCYVFAFIGPIESMINLYFNQHLDYDLSEQHVMDCFPEAGSCLDNVGGNYEILANRVENLNHALVDEQSYPWVSQFYGECFDSVAVNCKIHNLHTHTVRKNENAIKHSLITYGPLSARPRIGHAITLVGYKLIQAGDTININNGWHYEEPYLHPDTLVIPAGNPLIGRTVWIFKENDGACFGQNGYVYIVGLIPEYASILSPIAYSAPIIDSLNTSLTPAFYYHVGDGFYNWGLGPKPSNCPGPPQADCDDNDPFRLYYNENLVCTYDCDSLAQLVSNTPLVIANDTTIYGTIITRPIIVNYGVTLTLRGEFQCTENAYFMADIGSTIYAVGSTFQATCADNWIGFIGFANGDPSANDGNTGRSLIILRNCIVEDAIYGMVGDPIAILRAYNTTFRDNINDIAIEPFFHTAYNSQVNQNSGSEFFNCNFISTVQSHNSSCYASVSLLYCKDVDFKDCSFVDEGVNGAFFNQNNRICIDSYRAGFRIEDSYFDNMGYGIKAINSLYLPVDIKRSRFRNNHYAIYLSQVHAATIINDTIIFRDARCDSTDAEILPYGIYLDQCHDYHVEGNYIFMPNEALPPSINYSDFISGIVVNDSYNSNEQIYRNKIAGMAVGTQAVGLNRDVNYPQDGLKILCNDFSKNITDIFVTNNLTNPYPPGSPIGISQLQGTLTAPAGNYFTKASDFVLTEHSEDQELPNDDLHHKSAPIWTNIINDALYVNYYHHDTVSNSRVYPDTVYNVNRIATLVIYSDSTCLDYTIPQGNDSIIIIPVLRILCSQIEEVSETLENLTDGGSTELTVAEVVMATDNTAWQTYLSLMDKSPYLSDESLKEVAKKEDALTAPMVRDILVANPQAAKNSEISKLLDERIDELPAYMLAQIKAGLTEISPKEYLELQKSHLTMEYSRQSSALLRQYIREPDLYNASDVENLLNINNDVVSTIKLAEYYASQSNYSEAINVLNNINETNTMLEYDIDNLSMLYTLMQTIESDTLVMDEDRLNALQSFEAEGGIAGAYARGLLDYFNSSTYSEPLFLPEIMMSRKVIVSKGNKEDSSYLKVYPNPAKDFISVDYNLGEDAVAVIKILNYEGKLIQTIEISESINTKLLSVKDFSQGNYIICLVKNGRIIDSESVTIVK